MDNSSNDEAIVPSNRDVQMPVSHTRTHNTEMIPQLDGPMSVCSRRRMSENERMEQESSRRTAVTHRREYPDESSNDLYSGQRTYDDRRPPERRYQEGSGRPPDGGNNHDRGYSRRGRSPDRSGGPPDNGEPPDGGGAPDDGEPPGNR